VEKSSSKIIPGSQTDGIRQWQPPQMGRGADDAGIEKPAGKLLTADQLESLQKQAYDEGFEQGKQAGFEYGHKEGLTQGQAKIHELLQQLENVLKTLNTPLRELDEQVESELVELAIAMVRQLVRREVNIDPAHIVGVVREALGVLPVASRNVRLILHPEDAVLIREAYDVGGKELNWEIVEDPMLARGGCRVVTDSSQVDATLETRLAALIAPALSGEREEDRPSDDEA